MFQENPHTKNCLSKINLKYTDLPDFDYKSEPNFNLYEGCLYHIPKNYRPQSYIFAFDLDDTLTYHEKSLYVSHPDDIKLLPERLQVLNTIFKLGYTIVIFSNQSTIKLENAKVRFTHFLSLLNFPVYIYASLKRDSENIYRKPNIGMWELFMKHTNIEVDKLLFCGDALGRKFDFSDSDRIFAEKIRSEIIYSPETIFGILKIQNILSPALVIFIGSPGSGKSTLYKNNFPSFTHISKDIQKTKEFSAFQKALSTNNNIVVDDTNPKKEDRAKFISQAKEKGYNVYIYYFVINGKTRNSLREKPIPDIVYHTYYKKLEPPTPDEGEIKIVY